MNLQQPLLDNESVHVNQRLNNITRAMVQQELARIRAGNGLPGFSESQSKLMFTDRDERDQQRTRKVLAVEDRDAAFQEILDTHAHPGLGRFHKLVERGWPAQGGPIVPRFNQQPAALAPSQQELGETCYQPAAVGTPADRTIVFQHLAFQLHPPLQSLPLGGPDEKKEGVMCTRAMRTIVQQANLRDSGANILQSDNDP